ncbi:uncharacterized protein H6S33_002081 [Morchella sextelata]|uniref:uncharacterized protein n=1 Tax=Morchella sextelata TaxID=1174677 RepID=UPI001D040E4E|nr:uncharacterized protein H6S33_002081 [Morchella sextelata]KAH0608029.1 hypothetical protein H6S33_002081 [Morchella sextelata]
MSASVSTPSPLSALTRPAKQRRQSSYLTHSRRSSPLSIGRMNDSDEDEEEDGKAPQLSALAQMLLNDFPESQSDRGSRTPTADPMPGVESVIPRKRISWDRSPPPAARDAMMEEPHTHRRSVSPDYAAARELVTPAPGRYSRRVLGSGGSSGNSEELKQEEGQSYYGSVAKPSANQPTMTMQPSTTASASRWKRAGRGLAGGLAGPPRRGPRRGSDPQDMEGYEGYAVEDAGSEHNPIEIKEIDEPSSGSSSKGFGGNTSMREETPVGEGSFSMMSRRSRRSSPETSMQQQHPRSMSLFSNNTPEEMRSGSPDTSRRSSSLRAAAVAAAAAAAVPQVLAAKDKENMPPPPTFRRPTSTVPASKRLSFAAEEIKPVVSAAASRAPSPAEEKEYKSFAPTLAAAATAAAGSPERKNVLSMKSNNTPLRPPPPPPPPKMSMLEAVTASAGASATAAQQSSRKQRSVVHVNGKPYRRLDAIGKGGSSKVYKVMAENFKILAMKKVTFTAQDGESAIRGYKGEIDLLKKLAHVDRVVRLYDWEINDGKQCLTMLMECGETDLAKVLMMRHNNEDSQMDISFIRYYWREMLLCVESVHKLNIIHSDLKPANFLVVQGRLKLIDFGIANAIADDTVNVHRESQVGTLNYMSPEAIVDINAASGKAMASVGAPRLMKLGAPSDVWSLGCILYQMTYGRGPFAHLTSMYQKINAIPDPNYAIDYPATGIGGAPVPASLVATISGCLQRDKGERPTIARMLSYDDPFLNPDTYRPVREGVVDISYEVLKMLMENTVEHVSVNGAADKERVAAWATDVYKKLERRMWESRGGQR